MPNAGGGLQVGLGVEPTVSYSFGGKSENVLKMSSGISWRAFLLYGGKLWIYPFIGFATFGG